MQRPGSIERDTHLRVRYVANKLKVTIIVVERHQYPIRQSKWWPSIFLPGLAFLRWLTWSVVGPPTTELATPSCVSGACEPWPRNRQFGAADQLHASPSKAVHPMHMNPQPPQPFHARVTVIPQPKHRTYQTLCKSYHSNHHYRLSLPFFTDFSFPQPFLQSHKLPNPHGYSLK